MHWFQAQFASLFLVPLFAVAGFFGIHHPSIDIPFLATSTTPIVASTTPEEPVMCTMEAMQCPDGSWVGRTGPHCEFVCPGQSLPVVHPTPHEPATTTPEESTGAAPVIYSITPTSGAVGTEVSITGFGFTSDNVVHFGGGAIAHVPVSSSIAVSCTTDPSCKGGIRQTIRFTVPESIGPYCKPGMMCPMYMQLVTNGTYAVSVENDNGTSGTVHFTVTGSTQVVQ